MASRDTIDNRLDIWKDALKDAVENDRQPSGKYTYRARGSAVIPAQLRDDVEVFEYGDAPGQHGFEARAWAEESGTTYLKTLTSHEGAGFIESTWLEIIPPPEDQP
jgi:hypothetical protein